MTGARPLIAVCVAVTLVGGLLAAGGVGTAAAAGSTEDCSGLVDFWASPLCSPTNFDDLEAEGTSRDIHYVAVTSHEAVQNLRTVADNYLTDADSIASIRARSALADEYENGSSATSAASAASGAIRDYMAGRELNLIRSNERHLTTLNTQINRSVNASDVPTDFIRPERTKAYDFIDREFYADSSTGHLVDVNGVSLGTEQLTLVNGTAISASTLQIETSVSSGYQSGDATVNASLTTQSTATINGDVPLNDTIWDCSAFGGDSALCWDGRANVRTPVNAVRPPAQRVLDIRATRQLRESVVSATDDIKDVYGVAETENLFGALDNNSTTVAEIRGVEGLVLDSGSVGSEREFALGAVLGVPVVDGNASRFIVEYQPNASANLREQLRAGGGDRDFALPGQKTGIRDLGISELSIGPSATLGGDENITLRVNETLDGLAFELWSINYGSTNERHASIEMAPFGKIRDGQWHIDLSRSLLADVPENETVMVRFVGIDEDGNRKSGYPFGVTLNRSTALAPERIRGYLFATNESFSVDLSNETAGDWIYPANRSGEFTLATDSGDARDLDDGRFRVLRVVNGSGERVERVNYSRPDYSTVAVTDYRNLSTEYQELQAAVERVREQQQTGTPTVAGLFGGDIGSDIGIDIGGISLLVIIGGAIVLLFVFSD